MNLSEENCIPVTAGENTLSKQVIKELAVQIPGWMIEEKSMEREFQFRDFKGSIVFVNKVADLAEKQNHHPDICIFYSKVKLELSTHKIGGLSRNDFILAAKIDQLI
ncbi:MAG TPA: 4a-hydroxytetrahydrobiopterin dehydratase [Terriglobales bacterium]|nr:4a-hydroxytetrahydrobiopterin dehydratase [Terriglobales bacterium]